MWTLDFTSLQGQVSVYRGTAQHPHMLKRRGRDWQECCFLSFLLIPLAFLLRSTSVSVSVSAHFWKLCDNDPVLLWSCMSNLQKSKENYCWLFILKWILLTSFLNGGFWINCILKVRLKESFRTGMDLQCLVYKACQQGVWPFYISHASNAETFKLKLYPPSRCVVCVVGMCAAMLSCRVRNANSCLEVICVGD